MKCDMPDKPGLLEACYFEVFSSAALPFNLEMFIQTRWWNQMWCATLYWPVQIKKSIFWPVSLIISTCLENSNHSCCMSQCFSLYIKLSVNFCGMRDRLICISKWCVCLLAKVFLHALFLDVLTVSGSHCCLWHNGVIKHSVSISHISTTTRLFIDSQSVKVMLFWQRIISYWVVSCLLNQVTEETWVMEGRLYSTVNRTSFCTL